MGICPADNEWVEERIDRVLTQYRESPKLLFMLRTYLRQIEVIAQNICDVPSYFSVDTAVGDQLTLLGKRLGWPRCHCICAVQPVFGFECDGVTSEYPIAGFCDDNSTWLDCGNFGDSDICITDDDLYRKFLQVRLYQMQADYDLDSLTAAVKIFWGPQAVVLDHGNGRVVVAPNRALTPSETQVLQLYPRVLPTAPGIQTRFHFDEIDVFGFGDGWGGFCEPFSATGLPLGTEHYFKLATEHGVLISTGPLTEDAIWMCEVDVNPYTCP